MSPKIIDCTYWNDIGVSWGGTCLQGYYGGRPSTGTCLQCPYKNEPKSRKVHRWTWLMNIPLLGDQVAHWANELGLATFVIWWSKKSGIDCGCTARHIRWNLFDAKIRRGIISIINHIYKHTQYR